MSFDSGKQIEKMLCPDIHPLPNRQISADELLKKIDSETEFGNICVACSGGSDSVYLLLYILEKFHNIKKRIVVLHYNHNLRGEDSDGDEKFVKSLSKSIGATFWSEKLTDVPKNISENVLREFRNDFFSRAMRKFNSRFLVLGQQKNDVAETLLMRLTRGSDIAGLSAPREVNCWNDGSVRIRPLLDLTKGEIENRLKEKNIKWRDDKSNFGNQFFRNKIRNILLPQLQDLTVGYDVVENLASAKKNIESADDAVTFFANKYLGNKSLVGELEMSDLLELPLAVLKKILIKFFEINEIAIKKSYVDSILSEILQNNQCVFDVDSDRSVKFDGNKLILIGENKCNCWELKTLHNGCNLLPTGRTLRIQKIKIDHKIVENLKDLDVRARCLMTCPADCTVMSVKSYKSSYKYTRFGHKTERSLGDILTSKMVVNDARDNLPVIFVGDNICWVPNLPVSDVFKIKESDKIALLLTYF